MGIGHGVAIASGAACVMQNLAIPPALAAIGLDAAQAKGNVLLSSAATPLRRTLTTC